MKNALITAFILTAAAASASAATITAIYGSGNPNDGWTSDTGNGITLALRAKNRTNGDTTNVGGVYSFATAPATRGLWNYEFSIDAGNSLLGAYDYFLAVDGDSSAGISYTMVNPLVKWVDNSYGDSSTLNGAGVGDNNPAIHSIAQNSQNITFGDYPGGALPLENNATYSYNLYAVRSGEGQNGTRLANVGVTVVVGNGGTAVPDGGSSCILLGGSLVGLVGFRKFLRR